MIAEVEKPDGTFVRMEMGELECGRDFCDTCGDCLACYSIDCANGEHCGMPRWIIYADNPINPFTKKERTT